MTGLITWEVHFSGNTTCLLHLTDKILSFQENCKILFPNISSKIVKHKCLDCVQLREVQNKMIRKYFPTLRSQQEVVVPVYSTYVKHILQNRTWLRQLFYGKHNTGTRYYCSSSIPAFVDSQPAYMSALQILRKKQLQTRCYTNC